MAQILNPEVIEQVKKASARIEDELIPALKNGTVAVQEIAKAVNSDELIKGGNEAQVGVDVFVKQLQDIVTQCDELVVNYEKVLAAAGNM